MASSKSMKKGQVPKCCDLCEAEIKINWKCVNCDLLMCTKCKEKVHSKFKSADQHKIIDIKQVGKHSEELDFANIKCEYHERQTCVMFCKSCDQLVCPLCMAEVHNGHKFVQISEGYKTKIENAKEIKIQIKKLLEELTTEVKKIKLLREDEHSKYIKTKNLIQAHNAALKRDMDKYTEKLLKELDQKWQTLHNSMDQEEQKVTNLKNRKEDQDTKVDNILNSRDVDQVFKDSQQMGQFMKEAAEPVRLMDFTTMPTFLPREITEYNIGSLQDIPKDLVININKQFTTDLDTVVCISTCPDNSLWISDNNVIQRVKPEGSNLKVMSNYNMVIYDIALTPSNDLLMNAKKPSKLQQIIGSSGNVTDSVYDIDPLLITTVHVTSDYKVMVGARTPGPKYPATGRRVVIKVNKEGKHEMTYEHDRNKKTNIYLC